MKCTSTDEFSKFRKIWQLKSDLIIRLPREEEIVLGGGFLKFLYVI